MYHSNFQSLRDLLENTRIITQHVVMLDVGWNETIETFFEAHPWTIQAKFYYKKAYSGLSEEVSYFTSVRNYVMLQPLWMWRRNKIIIFRVRSIGDSCKVLVLIRWLCHISANH